MEVRLIEASECRGAKRPTAADYWPLPASKTESAIDGEEECARRAMPDLNNRKQEAAGSAARTRLRPQAYRMLKSRRPFGALSPERT